jgi:hypothetical protein
VLAAPPSTRPAQVLAILRTEPDDDALGVLVRSYRDRCRRANARTPAVSD